VLKNRRYTKNSNRQVNNLLFLKKKGKKEEKKEKKINVVTCGYRQTLFIL
jgi:hypothetical protein